MNYLEELQNKGKFKLNATPPAPIEPAQPNLEGREPIGFTEDETEVLSAPRYTKGDYVASGLVPALIGILGGAPESGYKVAADTLSGMKKEEDSDLDAMRKLIAARAKARTTASSSEKPATASVYGTDENGATGQWTVTRVGTKFIKPDGTQVTPVASEYQKEVTDEEGRKFRVPSKTPASVLGNSSPMRLGQGESPKIKDFIGRQSSDFKKEYLKNDDVVRKLEASHSELGRGNFQNKIAVMEQIKQIEQRLSDLDRTYYTGEISALDNLLRVVEEQTTSELNPTLVGEVEATLRRAHQRATQRGSDLQRGFTETLKTRDISKPEKYAKPYSKKYRPLGRKVYRETPTYKGWFELGSDGYYRPIKKDVRE